MDFFRARNRWQNCRTPRREEGRGHHEQRTKQVKHPDAVRRHREDEAERHQRAHEITGNHDPLAVKAIEQYTRDRPHRDGRNGARQEHAGDDQSRMG